MHKLVAAVAALALLTATLPASAAPATGASTQGAATPANPSTPKVAKTKKSVQHAKRHGLKHAKRHRLHPLAVQSGTIIGRPRTKRRTPPSRRRATRNGARKRPRSRGRFSSENLKP